MLEPRAITVFCGSSSGVDPRYAQTAVAFAEALVARGLGLVYGGGNCGLMGRLADAVLGAGGTVHGVIPDFLVESEHAHTGLTEMLVVRSMHERKATMGDLGGAFVALPGGLGTFEELFEVLTWSQLGIHPKPIGIVEVGGYFDPLQALLDRAVTDGFVEAVDRGRLIADVDSGQLIDRLEATPTRPSSINRRSQGR